ncbi:MAG TPA: ATP-binding protein [Kofleriaceae bacterium]|nr:ATP-binding protein [Kofleriaceae bacterium]
MQLGFPEAEPYRIAERRLADPQRDRVRLAMLAEVGLLFATRDDHVAILQRVADVAVPGFADKCTVYLRDPAGQLEQIALKQADPNSGAMTSHLVVPMIVRERVIGVLGLARCKAPTYDRDDLAFAEELARRIGLYLAHAMLLADQKRLIAELERTNRDLDQFASVASHDLRAPLRGIHHLAQILEEELATRLDDKTRPLFGLLQSRVRRLEDMIEAVLRYAHAGRITEAETTVDVGKLVHEVIGLLDPPDAATIDVAPLPVLTTVRFALHQVFLNLIGNALKHARKPDLRIEIGAAQVGDAWQLFVRDDGPGIAPEHHEQIWGMFRTLESRDVAEHTGMGLAIVRRIVESAGGRVWIESTLGAGATFHFTWPARPPRWRSPTTG